jgi:hypothetical protein
LLVRPFNHFEPVPAVERHSDRRGPNKDVLDARQRIMGLSIVAVKGFARSILLLIDDGRRILAINGHLSGIRSVDNGRIRKIN